MNSMKNKQPACNFQLIEKYIFHLMLVEFQCNMFAFLKQKNSLKIQRNMEDKQYKSAQAGILLIALNSFLLFCYYDNFLTGFDLSVIFNFVPLHNIPV